MVVVVHCVRHDNRSKPDFQHLHGGDGRRRGTPLLPTPCGCDRPLVTQDDDGAPRCLRCGREARG